jgi:hypothetical protein
MQVVTLRTDVLLRSLGPMASLLQKALLPIPPPPPGKPMALPTAGLGRLDGFGQLGSERALDGPRALFRGPF